MNRPTCNGSTSVGSIVRRFIAVALSIKYKFHSKQSTPPQQTSLKLTQATRFGLTFFSEGSSKKSPDDGLFQAETCCLNKFLKIYFVVLTVYTVKQDTWLDTSYCVGCSQFCITKCNFDIAKHIRIKRSEIVLSSNVK